MRFLLVLALVVGCKSKPSDQPRGVDENLLTKADVTKGNTETTSSKVPPKATKPTDEQMREIRKRLHGVQEGLAKLRGVPFKKSVKASYQTPEEFEVYIRTQLDDEYPTSISHPESDALHILGFTKQRVDLRKALLDTALSQAAAHYDPKTDEFYFLMGADSIKMLESIAAHELVHALQDQTYDLDKYGKEAKPVGFLDDKQLARMFVWEGEATLLMLLHGVQVATGKDPLSKENEKITGMQVAMLSKMDAKQMLAQTKMTAKMLESSGVDFKAAIEALDTLPPIITVPMMDAYIKGMVAVMDRYREGGWKAVDALYETPPTSTEQMLHPGKWGNTLDLPQKITMPKAPEGYTLKLTNNIGELSWRVFFDLWTTKGHVPATGWDGAQYAYFVSQEGENDGQENKLVAVSTVWDTRKDASEFSEALLEGFAERVKQGFSGRLDVVSQKGKRVDFYVTVGVDTQLTWKDWFQKVKISSSSKDKVK